MRSNTHPFLDGQRRHSLTPLRSTPSTARPQRRPVETTTRKLKTKPGWDVCWNWFLSLLIYWTLSLSLSLYWSIDWTLVILDCRIVFMIWPNGNVPLCKNTCVLHRLLSFYIYISLYIPLSLSVCVGKTKTFKKFKLSPSALAYGGKRHALSSNFKQGKCSSSTRSSRKSKLFQVSFCYNTDCGFKAHGCWGGSSATLLLPPPSLHSLCENLRSLSGETKTRLGENHILFFLSSFPILYSSSRARWRLAWCSHLLAVGGGGVQCTNLAQFGGRPAVRTGPEVETESPWQGRGWGAPPIRRGSTARIGGASETTCTSIAFPYWIDFQWTFYLHLQIDFVCWSNTRSHEGHHETDLDGSPSPTAGTTLAWTAAPVDDAGAVAGVSAQTLGGELVL